MQAPPRLLARRRDLVCSLRRTQRPGPAPPQARCDMKYFPGQPSNPSGNSGMGPAVLRLQLPLHLPMQTNISGNASASIRVITIRATGRSACTTDDAANWAAEHGMTLTQHWHNDASIGHFRPGRALERRLECAGGRDRRHPVAAYPGGWTSGLCGRAVCPAGRATPKRFDALLGRIERHVFIAACARPARSAGQLAARSASIGGGMAVTSIFRVFLPYHSGIWFHPETAPRRTYGQRRPTQ